MPIVFLGALSRAQQNHLSQSLNSDMPATHFCRLCGCAQSKIAAQAVPLRSVKITNSFPKGGSLPTQFFDPIPQEEGQENSTEFSSLSLANTLVAQLLCSCCYGHDFL